MTKQRGLALFVEIRYASAGAFWTFFFGWPIKVFPVFFSWRFFFIDEGCFLGVLGWPIKLATSFPTKSHNDVVVFFFEERFLLLEKTQRAIIQYDEKDEKRGDCVPFDGHRFIDFLRQDKIPRTNPVRQQIYFDLPDPGERESCYFLTSNVILTTDVLVA